MPYKRACKSCDHYHKKRVNEIGYCTYFPKWEPVRPDHWCSMIKYPRARTVKRQKRDERVAHLIEYYKGLYEQIYGARPPCTKYDWVAMGDMAQDRSSEEMEWLITEFLYRPPDVPHKKAHSVAAMGIAVREGKLVDREFEGRGLQVFLDSQMILCDDPEMWDQYETWVKQTGNRITFREWEISGPKE